LASQVEKMLEPEGCRVVENPSWALEDLEVVRQHAYSTTIGSDQLRSAFQELGGFPAAVFWLAMNPHDRDRCVYSLKFADELTPLFRYRQGFRPDE
jgi:hypothetical protein